MIANAKVEYRVITADARYIQTVLNQWLSTGYQVQVEQFTLIDADPKVENSIYTAVIRRSKKQS